MYSAISDYYHLIFPVKRDVLEFCEKNFKQNEVQSVLDAACGTGEYTREFARRGFRTLGVDLNERMILKARYKADEEGIEVNFKVADLKNLSFEVGDKFNATICIGNSLVHLLVEQDIIRVLKEINDVILPSGILIVQIVNYDRILKYRLNELPTIRRPEDGLIFTRTYDFRGDGLLDFHTNLTVVGSEGIEKCEGTVTLRPILQKELERWLEDTGYINIRFFGDFSGLEYSAESAATVLIAEKP